MQVEIIAVPQDEHGESPLWLAAEQALVWADVYDNPSIQRYEPATGRYKSMAMPRTTCCLAPRRSGGLLAGMQDGFFGVSVDGESTIFSNPARADGQEQLNDGKADAHGRFWCATLSRDLKTPNGRLLRLDPDGSTRHWDEGYITGNGVVFSPQYDRLYVADSRNETVWVYDFDLDAGTIEGKRRFLSTADMAGRPDGATIDSEGNYWVALIQGSAVIAIDPNGRIVERIPLPVEYPTMCSFGGADEDVLYVTSSRLSLDAAARERHPEAGSLIAIHGLGARGVPVAAFGG